MTEQKISKKPFKKMVAIDFDGVLHAYDTKWTDAATISDGPTPGAMAFLKELYDDDRFQTVIVSSRLKEYEGLAAVRRWLEENLILVHGAEAGMEISECLSFYKDRPPAFLTIDDRGWHFDGTWPSLDAIDAFRPWNKRPAVDGAPVMSADELPVPERMARYAAARGKSVDEVLADPDVMKVDRLDVVTEEVWTLDASQPLSYVTTRQRLFHESDEAGETRHPGDDGNVEAIRQRHGSLDAAFARYTDIEALIVAAVPAGTPISRASAGGDLGWRVGYGWLSVEGSNPSQPERIGDFARSLAAIPGFPGEKPRAGDPELVRRTLAAGRAL